MTAQKKNPHPAATEWGKKSDNHERPLLLYCSRESQKLQGGN